MEQTVAVGEIEFLPLGNEPGPEQLTPPEARVGLLRQHLSTTIAAGLWTAAAALCVLAPFRALFTESLSGFTSGLDGWGRVFVAGGFVDQSGPVDYHGTRYGVALIGCAALLAGLAMLTAVLAWSPPPWARSVRGAARLGVGVPAIGFTVFGVTLGTGLAELFDALAFRDRFVANVGSGDAGLPLGARPRFSIGGSVWLTFLAAACALAAVVASLAPMPEKPLPEPDVAESERESNAAEFPPAAHEDDEFLTG